MVPAGQSHPVAVPIGLDGRLFGKSRRWCCQTMVAVIGDEPLEESEYPRRDYWLVEQGEQMEPAATVRVRQQRPEPELHQSVVPRPGRRPVRRRIGVAAVVGVDV